MVMVRICCLLFWVCLEFKNGNLFSGPQASNIATAQVAEQVEVEVSEGYTMTQFCDKIIDVFMNEKPRTKEWRKLLVFREDWEKYRESFYNRCRTRADMEGDPTMKEKFTSLGRKVKKVCKCLYRVLLVILIFLCFYYK